MTRSRTEVPEDVAAAVLFAHDHTCCVCRERGLPVQIHHINEDPSDHDNVNLAVLCLHDHSRTQTRGGFGRHLKPDEVILYRDDWLARVIKRRQMADELAVQNAKGAVATPETIDWQPPSDTVLLAYLAGLPMIHKKAHETAQPHWDSGISSEMNEAAYDVISVLEQIWLHLSAWFPPSHFGEVGAAAYINEITAERFVWHRAINQPDGEGTSGTILGQVAAGGVMDDLATAIAETVRALIIWREVEGIDIDAWENAWNSAVERSKD